MEKIFDWMLSHPLIVILIILVLYVIFTYNNLNGKRHRANKSFESVNTYFSERNNSLMSLFDQVLEGHEHEGIYGEIAALRSGIQKYNKDKSGSSLVQFENQLSTFQNKLSSGFFHIENYPELATLNSEVSEITARHTINIESEISAAKRVYNSNVASFNKKITSFPTMLVAKLFGFDALDYYEFDPEDKKRPSMNQAKVDANKTQIEINRENELSSLRLEVEKAKLQKELQEINKEIESNNNTGE